MKRRARDCFALVVVVLISTSSPPVRADALEDWQAGYDAEQAGNPDLAIHHYTSAIRSGELNQRSLARVFRSRGNANHAAADSAEALNDYNTAIGLDPAYTLAYVSRGVIYHEAGDFERAIADYDEAVFLDPDYALTYANRGSAYEQISQIEEAVRDYRMAYELGLSEVWLTEVLAEYDALPGTAPAPVQSPTD
jgi:tetratricopeptide (TPR) repeat protein